MKEIVKVCCHGWVEESNNVWSIAQKLMFVTHAVFLDLYDARAKQFVSYTYDYFILDFKDPFKRFDEKFDIEPRPGYYIEEDIENWRKTLKIIFPPIHVYSLKVYHTNEGMNIEIETDKAYEVRKLFYLFADLGNGGHPFDGLIRTGDNNYNIGSFCFDCDGSDRVYKIDEDDLL